MTQEKIKWPSKNDPDYKEKVAAYKKQWRLSEKGIESSKRAMAKYKANLSEEKKAELRANANESRKRYQKANREKVTTYHKKWRNTPEGKIKFKAIRDRYRAKLRAERDAELERLLNNGWS